MTRPKPDGSQPVLEEVEGRSIYVRVPGARPATVTLVPKQDRRDEAARERLLRRVTSEFKGMPGLSLGVTQASRLFGASPEACARILHGLAEEGVLRHTS